MLYAEKVDDLRRRLEFFRERLSAEDADVNVGQNLTVTKIDDSVREFDIILGNLDKIVISKLERICYWDEIENILILIIENRNGIDLVERKQYAIDLINLGRMEKWISISDYLRGCLRCNLAEQMLLCGWNEDSRLMHINNYTGRCGVNNYQAQLINTEFAKSLMRREEAVYIARNRAQIEYLKYKAKHDEDLRFEREKNKMKDIVGSVANELRISDDKNDIDYRELEKRFIENTAEYSKLEQYMTLYVQFIESNYVQIVRDFMEERIVLMSEQFIFPRQAMIFRVMRSQLKLMIIFWRNYVPVSDDEFLSVYNFYSSILFEAIRENEQRAIQVEPFILFLQVVKYIVVSTGKIAQDKNQFIICSGAYNGYWDRENLMIKRDWLDYFVYDYYRKQGKIFPDSLKNILNALYKLNIIEGYEQKDHKAKLCKQVKVHNISEYFICFIWANVETTLNQVEYNRY